MKTFVVVLRTDDDNHTEAAFGQFLARTVENSGIAPCFVASVREATSENENETVSRWLQGEDE